MAIGIVTVSVPTSGTGSAADISALVGKKTVELSGTFNGKYVLEGRHVGNTYVPILIFDANGVESFKQTIEGAIQSVRLVSNATSPVGVSCNVSGISSAGDNQFTTISTLTVGSSGIQPSIDLFTLFPPTGLELDLNVICSGSFRDEVVIEGSIDGTNFNAIGSFRVDSQPNSLLGGLQILQFSPRVFKDLIRYVRVNVNGTIFSTTVVTIGGSTPFAGPASDTGVSVSDDDARQTLNGGVEVILYEWPINLSNLVVGANIIAQLNLTVGVDTPSTGTYRLYVGSTTPGNTTGGTVRASLTTTTTPVNEIKSASGAAFANPGGAVYAQITGQGVVGAIARAESSSVVIA